MKHLKTTLVIGALSTLGPFSVDTYFPSFPALAAHFGVSEIRMQSTLSCYLVALAGMNLFHGALSDSFGRRRVILTSLAIYSASALACVVAPGSKIAALVKAVEEKQEKAGGGEATPPPAPEPAAA